TWRTAADRSRWARGGRTRAHPAATGPALARERHQRTGAPLDRRVPHNGAMPHTLSDWLAWIERQHPRSIAMGLDRVREVAARMGLARPARHVITVGGTNGKGSTVAFIE